MTLKQGVRDFYFWQLSNGKSAGTSKLYRTLLEDFESRHPGIGLREITFPMVQDYLFQFKNSSPSTINGKKACLRSFFSWSCDAGFLEKNPARMLRAEKIIMKEASFMSKGEIDKFRDSISNARDQLLFELYLQTGCRLSEIQGLNIADVQDKDSFQVIGKGRKVRQVYLNPSLTNLIKNFVNGNSPDSPLFISRRGTRLSISRIQGMFQNFCEKAGIQGKFSVHSLRHTFATHLYDKSKDILLVSQLLGHSNIQTTTRYAHLGEDRKRQAVSNLYS